MVQSILLLVLERRVFVFNKRMRLFIVLTSPHSSWLPKNRTRMRSSLCWRIWFLASSLRYISLSSLGKMR